MLSSAYLATRQGIGVGDPLFLSRKGHGEGHLQRAQAYKIINDAARAVGITEATGTHTLRKTFGYHAYREGKDIAVIQSCLTTLLRASPWLT